MLGMMQIMIWMFCLYLIFKGIEIFQIALVSPREGKAKIAGVALGIVMVVAAGISAIVFFVLEESMAHSIQNSQTTFPGLR